MSEEDSEDRFIKSPMEVNDRPGLFEDEMDKKDNGCLVQGDFLLPSMQRKRNKRGQGCNLRKSLAWNQAFLTEEGVLNPLELSRLSKSSTRSSGNPTLVSQMSPLPAYNNDSIWPPLRNVATDSQNKDSKSRRLYFSSNKETDVHVMAGKTPSSKSIFKNIPRSPATNSQKRIANVSSANPTSKLPKYTPSKLHAFPTTSGNAMLTTKSSKADNSAGKVVATVGKSAGVRIPDSRKDFACSSSSSNFATGNHGNILVKNYTVGSNVIQNRSSSTEHEPVACGPGKVASSLPQGINHIPRGPPAAAHARPSALRMPSPSLGFFCQGKATPSYNNQLQRHSQPSESKIPSIRQPQYVRPNCHLQTLPASVIQQSAKGAAAENSIAASLISSSSHACLAASFLNSPATHNTYPLVERNTEMKQVDDVDRRASINFENLCCQKDSPESPGFNHLDIYKPSGVPHLDKFDSCKFNEIDYYESSSKIRNRSSVQEVQQFPITNSPENGCDARPPTKDSCISNLSSTSELKISYQGELQDCDLKDVQGASCVHNNALQSHDKVATDESYSVAIENIRSDVISDLASGFADGSMIFTPSIEAKSSPKDEIVGTGLNGNSESDCSLAASSGIYGEVETEGSVCMSSTLSEKCEPKHSDEQDLQDCRSHCDSTELDLLMSRNKMGTDTARQKALLNVEPFSDEWVAALEACGEEILEKKTGPVQNSPPDKAVPEPGPWSPVKKKAQDIGPFDCTKYSKNLTTSSAH